MNTALFLLKNRKLIIKVVTSAFLVVIATFFLLFSGGSLDDDSLTTTQNLPESVLRWKPQVTSIANKNKIPEYTDTILGIIMVESGGNSLDLMQSSESAGLPPNSLLSPTASLEQGIKFFATLVNEAKQKKVDNWTPVQAYNFGGNYIDFVSRNGKKHSTTIAEKYSKTVVAPSLGNNIGATYSYKNAVSLEDGRTYLYMNGGNFHYVGLVKQFVVSSSGNLGTGKGDLSILKSQMGRALYNGECYGLTAYYVDKLGGPKLMGSGFQNASDIGTDYDWKKYGWEVKVNPKYSDIKPGDIVNFAAGNGFAIPYGHTGIAKSATKDNVTIYDQWQGHGTTLSTYDRPLTSIVRKVK